MDYEQVDASLPVGPKAKPRRAGKAKDASASQSANANPRAERGGEVTERISTQGVRLESAGKRVDGRPSGRVSEAFGGARKEKRKWVGKVPSRPGDISPELQKKAIRAMALGMPLDRVVIMLGFPDAMGSWARYCEADPEFGAAMRKARAEGEVDLLLRVEDSAPGWQGSAWLLERARGYTARASIDHTSSGRPLSVVAQVFTALNEPER